MDDNEGYDSFEINDTDLEYALNPDARRFRQTKEQQIYGIWADNDDDYDTRPSFSKRSTKIGGPVRFVSGGMSVGNKMDKEDEEGEQPGPSCEKFDEDIVEIPLIPEKRAKPARFGNIKSDNGMKSFAGMRDSTGNASWASSTVMKMMKNMGWQHGKGLGQKGQGIVEPVQAILRPGRGAVGAYGNETKGLKFGENAGDAQRRSGEDQEDMVETTVEEARSNAWKKSHAGKIKPKFKTLDEIVREGNDLDQLKFVQKSNVKFIDMTGPNQKVYDSIQSFQQQTVIDQQEKRKNFNVPALTENLDHLIMSCKNEIHLNSDHIQDLKNKTSGMEREKTELEHYIEEAAKVKNRVEEVLDFVKRFDNSSGNIVDVLDEYLDLFQQIKDNYSTEFNNFGLDCLVEFKVLPVMKQLFAEWNPLDSLTIDHGIEQMRAWKDTLATNKETVFGTRYELEKGHAYDLLVWNAWMPAVQRAATRWNACTDFNQMIELIGTWISILPSWIQDNLFDNVIIQKLRAKVDDWDPINDEIPIDSWIIPWHEILGDRLLIVYPPIRQKLAKALKYWQATDLTAVAVLKPWKQVFSHSTMQTFLKMNIVPKLEDALRTMNLNPTQNTEYKEFYAVLEWQDLLSQELICSVLINGFFSRWYENLCRWLGLPNSLDDVSRYYREWRERMPTELSKTKPIHAEFVRALMAIKDVRQGKPITPMPSFEQLWRLESEKLPPKNRASGPEAL